MSDIQLGIKITADGTKATTALDQIGNSTKKVGQDIANLNAGWAKLNDQFAKQTAAKAWAEQLGQASHAAQKLKQSTENAASAWAKLSQQGMKRLEAGAWAERLSVDTAKTTQAIKALDAQIDRTRRGIAIFGDSGLAASRGINALSLATAGFAAIASTKALFEAARDMERLSGMMSSASGGSQAAAANLKFVTDTANRLGISMTGAADAFAQLTASAQGTALQGQATRDIFQAVAQASAALGKSSYDTAGMLTAISQMMSKGKVSAEELRGQLGERLPGAFNLAAKAMGVSTQALDEMLTKGEIMAADFLPRFAKVLDETYSQSRFDRLNNEVARLDNAWTQFKRNLTDTSGFKSAIETLTGLLTGMNSVLEKSKQYGADAFKIMPNRADVARALAGGQTGLDPNTAQAAIGQATQNAVTAAASLKGLTSAQIAVADRIIEAAKSAKLDPALALAVAQTESRFRQSARSPVGAMGVMQLMPGTARGLGVNPANEQENIQGGIKYLKQLQGEFKTLTQIAAGYNAGPGNVRNDKWMRFAETRDYVQKVTAAYQQFKAELKQDDGFNVAREQFDSLRDATQRYIADLDDQAKAAQRQAEVAISGIDNQIAALDRERDAWDKSQQDKIDAAKGNYDAMAKLEAERAAKLQDYAARELALIQQQYDARKQAMEASAAASRKQLDSPNQLTDDEERRAKLGLADIQADLVKLANERAQAEAKAGQAAMDANRGGLELAQKQREFIANINADLEFQKQLYLQLKAAKEAGASAEGLSLIAGAAEQSRQLPGTVSAEQIATMDRAIAQRKIYEQQTADLMQTEQDRAESVREQQLRENAYWDQLMGRTESLANLWTQIYGAQAAGMANLTVAMARYSKDVEQIQQRWNDPNTKKQWGDMSGLMEGLQQAQAGAVALSETMLAIRSTTEQGTKAYDDLTTAAGNFAIVGQWLNIVEGIGAVIHQLNGGDVYTAIPRALGVAAMVASMGVQTGAIGSAGTQNATAKYNDGTNKGVFGDTTAASESITKSLEIIRDNSSNDLNYSAAMLRALEGIEAAMGGVTNTIIRGVQPAAFKAGVVMTHGDIVDPGGLSKMDPILSFMNKLMFNITRRVSDFGLAATSQALSAILKQGFSGSVYTDIETSTKVLGMTVAKSVKTVFQDMDPAIAKQFTLAFQSISTAIVEGGKAFGLTAEDFVQRMRGFMIDIEKVSTKDMTGEELQNKITQMFSEQSDRMARRFMPGLGKFQQVGEGYFQTFVRVAEAVNRAGGELERLGIKAISYRNIERKQADIAAEIVRESLLQQTGLATGVRQYVAELSGSAEDIIDAYKKLKEASSLMQTAGAKGGDANLNRTMINAAGGLDAFVSSMQDFKDTFLTDAERLSGDARDMAGEFAKLGLRMPTTNDEFKKLVQGLDTSTEAGQKLFGKLVSLSGGFAKLTAAVQTSMDALKSSYDTAKAQSKSLHDYLAGLRTGDSAAGSPMDRYRAAKARFEDLKTRAQAGDQSAIDALQGAASDFLSLSKLIFAGTEQYSQDLNAVEVGLGKLAGLIDDQISAAEKQVPALLDNTSALTSLNTALANYTAAVDALKKATDDAAKAYTDGTTALIKGIDTLDRIGGGTGGTQPIGPAGKPPPDAPPGGAGPPPYAMGGLAAPGWALVGEQGPELVNFTSPARVYTANQTREALIQKDDGKTFAALEAIKDEMRALVRTQSGANPAIIGELQALRARLDQLERNQRIKA